MTRRRVPITPNAADVKPRKKPGPAKRPERGQQQVDIADRRAEAVRLKAMGWTYDSIAKQLGFSNPSHAFREVKQALRDRPAADVDYYRREQLAELERFKERLLPHIGALTKDGKLKRPGRDLQQMMVAIRIQERIDRLLGLAAPQKVQHSGTIGTVERSIAKGLTEAELDAYLNEGIIPERIAGTNGAATPTS